MAVRYFMKDIFGINMQRKLNKNVTYTLTIRILVKTPLTLRPNPGNSLGYPVHRTVIDIVRILMFVRPAGNRILMLLRKLRKFKNVKFTWVSPVLHADNFQGIDNLKFTTSEKFEEYLSCHHYMGH